MLLYNQELQLPQYLDTGCRAETRQYLEYFFGPHIKSNFTVYRTISSDDQARTWPSQ
jgi:hypothetical protein